MNRVITFHEAPWRHYRINATTDNPMHPWTQEEPWGAVASVTQILGCLDKPAIPGWVANVTCEASWRMDVEASSATITRPIIAGLRKEAAEERKKRNARGWLIKWLLVRARDIQVNGYSMPNKWRQFQKEMRHAGLDHRSITGEAQLRGTTVHKIGEGWQTEGKFPVLSDYPEEWRGYIRAIAKFLAAHGEGLSVAEEITGSVRYGFAGTCDTVAVSTFGDARVRLDYKTSKQTYARTHFRQLGAYELGAVDGGDEPCDRLGIVILGADGEFSISFADEVEWRTTPADSFLRVLDVWRDEQPLKKHEDATYKARIARERASNG